MEYPLPPVTPESYVKIRGATYNYYTDVHGKRKIEVCGHDGMGEPQSVDIWEEGEEVDSMVESLFELFKRLSK